MLVYKLIGEAFLDDGKPVRVVEVTGVFKSGVEALETLLLRMVGELPDGGDPLLGEVRCRVIRQGREV